MEQAQERAECQRLAKHAPADVQEQVDAVLESKSKYLDAAALRKWLEQKAWTKNRNSTDFINKEQLLRDIQQGNALQDFLKDFNHQNVDVVSLAEMRTVVKGMKATEDGSGPTRE